MASPDSSPKVQLAELHGTVEMEIVGGLQGEDVETVIPVGIVDAAGKTDAEMTDSADDTHMADEESETQIITQPVITQQVSHQGIPS